VVEIVLESDGSDHVIVTYDAGRFVGELGLLTGQRVFVSARVVEPGEVVVLSREALRHVITTSARLSDTLLTAFAARHTRLLTSAAEAVRLVGSRFSPQTRRFENTWCAAAFRTSGTTPIATTVLPASFSTSELARPNCQLAYRELLRVPNRYFRWRPDTTRVDPGRKVRRVPVEPVRRHIAT
jgi:CRP-like cAMP-binding protein